jgi:hypothetical protein
MLALGQLKAEISNHNKKQAELLESRIDKLSSDFEGRLAGLKEELSSDSAHTKATENLIENRISAVQKSLRKEIEGIRMVSKVEDKKLEERLAGLMQDMKKEAASEIGRFRSEIAACNKRQLDLIDSKVKKIYGDFESGVLKLADRVTKERAELKGVESLVGRKIRESQDGFLLKENDLRKKMESELAQIKAQIASYQKRQMELLGSKMGKLYSDFESKTEKLRKELSSESLETKAVESLIEGKIISLKKSLGKEIDGIRMVALLEDKRIESAIKKQLNRTGLVKSVLEKELSGTRKEMMKGMMLNKKAVDEKIEKGISGLYSHAASEKKELKKAIVDCSTDIANVNNVLKAVSASGLSLQKRLSDSEERIKRLSSGVSVDKKAIEKTQEDKISSVMAETEKKLSAQGEYIKNLESALARVVKALEKINVDDDALQKKFSVIKDEFSKKLIEDSKSFNERMKVLSSLHEEIVKRVSCIEDDLQVLSEKTEQQHKQTDDAINEMRSRVADEENRISEQGKKSPELKEQLTGLVKSMENSKKPEIARLLEEIARIKKDVSDLRGERESILRLVEEED